MSKSWQPLPTAALVLEPWEPSRSLDLITTSPRKAKIYGQFDMYLQWRKVFFMHAKLGPTRIAKLYFFRGSRLITPMFLHSSFLAHFPLKGFCQVVQMNAKWKSGRQYRLNGNVVQSVQCLWLTQSASQIRPVPSLSLSRPTLCTDIKRIIAFLRQIAQIENCL